MYFVGLVHPHSSAGGNEATAALPAVAMRRTRLVPCIGKADQLPHGRLHRVMTTTTSAPSSGPLAIESFDGAGEVQRQAWAAASWSSPTHALFHPGCARVKLWERGEAVGERADGRCDALLRVTRFAGDSLTGNEYRSLVTHRRSGT